MNITEKIRLTKAVLLRIYKKEREKLRPNQQPEELSFTVRDSSFVSLGDAGITKDELNDVIFPYLKEQHFFNNFSFDSEEDYDEYSFNFTIEIADHFTEPIEQPMVNNTEVTYDELNHVLGYGSHRYSPHGETQQRALAELWNRKAWPSKGIGGERIPLHTFGSRIGFENIDSAQKFQQKLENDDEFKRSFKNFYTGIRTAIYDNEIPASLTVVGNAIQLSIDN